MTSKATTELQIKMIHIILNYGLATILTIILIAVIISLKRFKKEIKHEEKSMKDINLKMIMTNMYDVKQF